MLENISVFHFLIYAAGIGFAAAIIYTNIQRTAYSKFFNYLLDNGCHSADKAKALSDMGLSSVERKIITSAVKHQYGFKKYVKVVGAEKSENEIEALFDRNDNASYYLENADEELLRKKYTFKTMPARLVILFIAALALVVVIASSSVSWLIDRVTTPKMDETEETQEQGQEKEYGDENEGEQAPDFITPDQSETPEIPLPDSQGEQTAGPRIPV